MTDSIFMRWSKCLWWSHANASQCHNLCYYNLIFYFDYFRLSRLWCRATI